MKMNEIYEAPAVEIVKVAVEAGFSQSDDASDVGGIEGGGSLD